MQDISLSLCLPQESEENKTVYLLVVRTRVGSSHSSKDMFISGVIMEILSITSCSAICFLTHHTECYVEIDTFKSVLENLTLDFTFFLVLFFLGAK